MEKIIYSEYGREAVHNMMEKMIEARQAALEIESAASRPSFVEFTTNKKLQGVTTFCTLPGVDCGQACRNCLRGCYALRHQMTHPRKREQAARNSARLANDRAAFFSDIEARARLSVVFRWHESGEIIDADYLRRVIDVAQKTPACVHLIFTKRADLVNAWMEEKGRLPENLRLLLSAWDSVGEVAKNNPYNLPLSAPDFSGLQVAKSLRKDFDACGLQRIDCIGDCARCYIERRGCFAAGPGSVVVFPVH